jgi:hypothetical protein
LNFNFGEECGVDVVDAAEEEALSPSPEAWLHSEKKSFSHFSFVEVSSVYAMNECKVFGDQARCGYFTDAAGNNNQIKMRLPPL